MIFVDAHCHAGLHKYEPIESLLYHMGMNGVERAVLIQHQGEFDNSYHVECIKQYPDRFASAMIVPPEDDGRSIHHWFDKGITGIRFKADSLPNKSDSLVQWSVAAELELVVSFLADPKTLLSEEFYRVLTKFPKLHIVIEHLAGITVEDSSNHNLFKRILKLAKYEQLSIKLPGFGEFCSLPYPFTNIPELVDMTLNAFGPKRMMWGSDYPPVSSREGYKHSLDFPLNYFSSLSEDERAWIFGRSAMTSWRMKDHYQV